MMPSSLKGVPGTEGGGGGTGIAAVFFVVSQEKRQNNAKNRAVMGRVVFMVKYFLNDVQDIREFRREGNRLAPNQLSVHHKL
jgi:hypothetical protein